MIEQTKNFIKSTFPSGVRAYRWFREAPRTLHVRVASPQDIFSRIYANNVWGSAESTSGPGSTLARTDVIRGALRALLESVGARSMLDLPCGDFNWMQHVDLGTVDYVGADVVPELIARNRQRYGSKSRRFAIIDVTRDDIPTVDVILCRDCFIHLSFKHIRAALDNFKRSNSTYLLATTHTNVRQNADTHTGLWRSVNLQAPPFDLPPPAPAIIEDPEHGKCLGLWRIEDL